MAVHGRVGGGEHAERVNAAAELAEGGVPAAEAAWVLAGRFDSDELGAWRYTEEALTPLRLKIRQVARALLVHPRYLPYDVVTAIATAAPGPAAREPRPETV